MIDNGWAQLKEEFLRLRLNRESPITLEHGYDLRKETGKMVRSRCPYRLPKSQEKQLSRPGRTGTGAPATQMRKTITVVKSRMADLRW